MYACILIKVPLGQSAQAAVLEAEAVAEVATDSKPQDRGYTYQAPTARKLFDDGASDAPPPFCPPLLAVLPAAALVHVQAAPADGSFVHSAHDLGCLG